MTTWTKRTIRTTALLGAFVAMLAGSGANASGTAISGSTPYVGACGDPAQIGAEVEAHVAVNPNDPLNAVAAWQQDRHLDGGARGNVVAYTKDGGSTWTRVVVPGISQCSGGPARRATDPWLGFGTNGVVYLASMTITPGSGMVVSRSLDGGATWSQPVVVTQGSTISVDKQTLTVDPYVPDNAYMVWVGSPLLPWVTFFSRTTDAGRTWLPPIPISAPVGPSFGGQGNQIVVLGDGSLLNLFTDLALTGYTVKAMRSFDKGLTWGPAVPVARIPTAEGPSDPATGERVRAGGWIASVGRTSDGRALVAWADDDEIILHSSADGILWKRSVVSSGPAAKFTPAVAGGPNGRIGVTWYDWRNNDGASSIRTDLYFASSTDGGSTWSERQVHGSFDLRHAPVSSGRGYFLGDYQGLAGWGNDFLSIAPIPVPSAYSDVYAHRID